MNTPTLLLADEPTGNLNSEAGDAVLNILTSLHDNEGMSVVMVTHDARIAALAPRQVVLQDGRVASDETQAGSARFVSGLAV